MNASANASANTAPNFNLGNYLYIGNGTFGTAFNVLILAAIFRAKHLRRKENLLVSGLAIFSLIYSLFSLSIGAYRLTVSPFALVPLTYCLKFPQSAAVVFAPIGCTCMLFMISLDRLIAAQWFQHYLILGKRYSVKVICSVVVFSAVFTLVAYLGSIFELSGTFVSAFCITPFTGWFLYLFTIVDLIFNFCTIFLHMLALFIIWYRTIHAHAAVQAIQFKRQRSVTIKLSIVTVSMFFMHSLPRLAMAMNWSIIYSMVAQQMMFTAIGVHAALQVLFYAAIKRELRSEMINILTCRGTQVSHVALVVTPQMIAVEHRTPGTNE